MKIRSTLVRSGIALGSGFGVFLLTIPVFNALAGAWWVYTLPEIIGKLGAQLATIILVMGPTLLSTIMVFILLSPKQININVVNCAHCGYDLRGLGSLKCPECGTPIPPDQIVRIKHTATAIVTAGGDAEQGSDKLA